jgi:hypothetical protein
MGGLVNRSKVMCISGFSNRAVLYQHVGRLGFVDRIRVFAVCFLVFAGTATFIVNRPVRC